MSGLQEPGLQGAARSTIQRLPRSIAGGRLALSLDATYVARGRAHRLGRGTVAWPSRPGPPRGPGRIGAAETFGPSSCARWPGALRGVKLVISDDHKGLRDPATWQRCRALRPQPAGPCRPPGPRSSPPSSPPRRRTPTARPVAQVADQPGPRCPSWQFWTKPSRPRLHDFPQGAPPEIALHKPDRGSMPRSSAANVVGIPTKPPSHGRRRHPSRAER